MDVYMICNMLAHLNSDSRGDIIAYTGHYHTMHYRQFFIGYSKTRPAVSRPMTESMLGVNRCIKI